MARLLVIFANRYLSALAEQRRGGNPSRCWEIAFDASQSWRPIILQHLLLGINAHINLDLGIAAAETAPGSDLPALKGDFDEISLVLGEMMNDVQATLGQVSPWMGFLDRIGGRTDEAILSFSLGAARDLAWLTAERFARLDRVSADVELDRIDRRVAALAYPILSPGLRLSLLLLFVRARETRDISAVVEVLTD
jgi:hypothetical protein